VTSLIDGVAAIASAQIGDLVGPTTLLTTVSQVNPIKAYFPLSEQEYLGIADQVATPASAARLWQSSGGLTLVLADGSTYPQRGTVLAVDREVDPKMGTIRVSALFPNPGNVLRPGQYGRVRAQTAVRKQVVLVPQRAVTELQTGYQVRVLTPDNHAAVRSVELGQRIGNRWIVEKGLAPGDRVVLDAPSLKDGTLVKPQPAAPGSEAH
jgi:membrane fusion protein (multidrug efflux system)